jgi:hypothetical protein
MSIVQDAILVQASIHLKRQLSFMAAKRSSKKRNAFMAFHIAGVKLEFQTTYHLKLVSSF